MKKNWVIVEYFLMIIENYYIDRICFGIIFLNVYTRLPPNIYYPLSYSYMYCSVFLN